MQLDFMSQGSRDAVGLLLLASLEASSRGRAHVGTGDLLEVFARRGTPFLQPLGVDPAEILATRSGRTSESRQGLGAGEDDPAAVTEHELEVDALLREVEWRLRLKRNVPIGEPAIAFSGALKSAVRASLVCAESYGRRYVSLAHLLAGALQTPGCDAVRLMEGLGYRPERLLSDLPVELMKLEGRPISEAIVSLERTGLLASPDKAGEPASWLLRVAAVLARRAKPIVQAMNRDACRLAVRYGAAHVNQTHYVLAIFLLQRHLDAYGLRFVDSWAARNDAGDVLRRAGVAEQSLVKSVAQTRVDEAAEHLKRAGRGWRRTSPPYGQSVVAATARAERHAARLRQPYTGTQHLLVGLIKEGGAGVQMLQALNVDTGRLLEALEEV